MGKLLKMNLQIFAHTAQERYSSMVLAKLRKELILKDGVVFNNDYEGNPKAGAVKVPVRDGEVAVGDYDKATGIALGTGTTTYLDILVNKDKAVNEIIDGYVAAAVPDRLIADRLDSAGYTLAYTLDNDGATELLTNGLKTGISMVDSTNIYDQVVDIRKAMSKDNIPNDGKRYLLATPEGYAMMLKDKDNFIRQGDLSQNIKATGAIGQYAGFNVYEWNDATANLLFIAGHPRYATRVNEWSVPVAINDLTNTYIGASAVQGRMVYTHKVLRNKGVRAVFYPSVLTLTAEEGSTAGKTIITVAEVGTFKYKLNPTSRAVYDQADSGFTALTSGTTEITAAAGTVIEVVQIVESKVAAVGYIEAV